MRREENNRPNLTIIYLDVCSRRTERGGGAGPAFHPNNLLACIYDLWSWRECVLGVVRRSVCVSSTTNSAARTMASGNQNG